MSFFVGVTGLKKKKYSYELFCWAYNLAAMQKFISLIDEFYFLTKLDKDY